MSSKLFRKSEFPHDLQIFNINIEDNNTLPEGDCYPIKGGNYALLTLIMNDNFTLKQKKNVKLNYRFNIIHCDFLILI